MATRTKTALGLDVGHLRVVAGGLAVLVAGVHILHPRLGAPRLVLHLRMGTLFDPRPLVFTLTAFAILFGVLLAYQGLYVRQVYLVGMALMLTLLLGFAVWHTLLSHGGFWPHLPTQGHVESVPVTVWRHLVGDAAVAASKLLELATLVVLTVLYRFDTTRA